MKIKKPRAGHYNFNILTWILDTTLECFRNRPLVPKKIEIRVPKTNIIHNFLAGVKFFLKKKQKRLTFCEFSTFLPLFRLK